VKSLSRSLSILLLAAIGLVAVTPGAASAHERRTVADDYTLMAGLLVEPALEGQMNGIEMRVTRTDTNEGVEGVHQTLKVEVVMGNNAMPISLRPVFRQPGSYTGDFVPTRTGAYAFRLTGTIDGRPVSEVFEVGDVEAMAPLQFPDRVPSTLELQRPIATMEGRLAAAEGRAATATTLGIVGLAAGLAALALAVWTFVRGRGSMAPTMSGIKGSPAAPAARQERV
jgi:hypothetical protein